MFANIVLSGAGLWNTFFIFLGVAWLLAVCVDMAVLYFAKWKPFNETFGDAFMINIASGGANLILYMGGISTEISTTAFYLLIPFTFILVEGAILSARREGNSRKKTWGLTILMNLVTYGLLALGVKAFL